MNIYRVIDFRVRSYKDWDVVVSATVSAETSAAAASLLSDHLMQGAVFPAEERLDLRARLIREFLDHEFVDQKIIDLDVRFRKEP